MKLTKIKADKVKDGDVLYIPHNYMVDCNEHLLGSDSTITGSDVIIIVDDSYADDTWLINGGFEFFPDGENNTFYKIGHYSDIVNGNHG